MYGEVKELLTDDAPTPLGNYFRFTDYVNAKLFHGQLTGRSITCILNLVNKAPVDWYSKK